MNAAYRFIVSGTLPLGALLGGALGSWLGLRGGIAVAAEWDDVRDRSHSYVPDPTSRDDPQTEFRKGGRRPSTERYDRSRQTEHASKAAERTDSSVELGTMARRRDGPGDRRAHPSARRGLSGQGIEETNESQSLIANLATVDDIGWRAAPSGRTRTVESVVLHVVSCKVMYDEYAFGPRRLTWDDPTVQPWREGEAPRMEALAWLTDAHNRLMEHVRALDADDLARARAGELGGGARDPLAAVHPPPA
jgi:hypothetical protein